MAIMNSIFTTYMNEQKFSAHTVRAYTRNVQEFLDFVNKPDEEIKTADVRAWVKSLDGLSSATVSQKIASVRTYFDVLIEYDFLEINPADVRKVKSPKVQNKEKHHMSASQIHDMMNACRDVESKAIICLFASSGMRVSELTDITVSQYKTMRAEGKNRMYIIGKGNKKAPVIFNDQSCNLIDQYLKVRCDQGTGCDKLFLSGWGNPIVRNRLSEHLKVIAKDAGISWYKQMSPHQLRAGCATILSDKGVPVAQIRDVLRHSSVATTNRYIKTSENVIENNVMDMSF